MDSVVEPVSPWLAAALAVLHGGGVVAVPTESTFGLLADARAPEALERLFALKPRNAGVALMLPSPEAWPLVVDGIPRAAQRLAASFWPGPLTIALPARTSVDPRLTVDGTVGVRVAGPSRAAELCRAFGGPVTATSANAHGAPPATTDAEVRAAFGGAERAGRLHVVTGRCPGGAPSTIVVVKKSGIFVAREGAIAACDIEAAGRAAL